MGAIYDFMRVKREYLKKLKEPRPTVGKGNLVYFFVIRRDISLWSVVIR